MHIMVMETPLICSWTLRRLASTSGRIPVSLIFFARSLVSFMRRGDTSFKTPTETIEAYPSVGEIDVPHILTWADTDRDLTAWVGNDIQKDAIRTIWSMIWNHGSWKTRDLALIENVAEAPNIRSFLLHVHKVVSGW
jgi:alpha-amylase/alpha-mannosidase (GH57 family)